MSSTKYDPQKTRILAQLRSQAGLKQDEVAAYFGLEEKNRRGTVGSWELGNEPPGEEHRSKFVDYLCDKLGLRGDPEHLEKVWNEVMVGQWRWLPLTPSELRRATYPTSLALIPSLPQHAIVGRDRLIEDIRQRLFTADRFAVCALYGIPGVGKTTLAIAIAHDQVVQEHFHEGILWASLGEEADTQAVLAMLGNDLGIPSSEMNALKTPEDRASRIRDAIGTRRMLLILDDAWHLEQARALQVGNNCAYLLTTKQPELASSFGVNNVFTVPDLDASNGLILMKELASKVVEVEADKVESLVIAVGGLPLSLVLMGNYLRVSSQSGQPRRIIQALSNLQKAQDRLKLAESQSPVLQYSGLPKGANISVEAVISISYRALDKAARRTLLALSVFPPKPNTFSESAALEVSRERVEALDTLYKYGLMESSPPGRYRLHTTITDYAQLRLRNKTVYRRMVNYFVDYIEAHEKDYDSLDTERANILAALDVAFKQGMQAVLVKGVNALYRFLETRGLYSEAEKQLGRARTAAVSLADILGLATVMLNLGELAERRGDLTQAEECLEEGLSLVQRTEHRAQFVALTKNLGVVMAKRGNLEQAEAYFLEGLAVAREIGDQEKTGALLVNLGVLADMHGDYPRAEELYRESLVVTRDSQDRATRCALLQNLAVVVMNQGEYIQAQHYLRESLDLAYGIGDSRRASHVLISLGMNALYLGDYAQAEQHWLKGLDLARQIGNHQNVSSLLTNLGWLAGNRGDYVHAEEHLQEGLDLARRIDHRENVAYALESLGAVAARQEHYAQAENYLQEGMAIARDMGHQELISALLQDFGSLARHRKEYAQAENYLQESITIARDTGLRWYTSAILNEQGELELAQGKIDSAYASFLESFELATQMGAREHIAADLFGFARVLYAQGNNLEAHRKGQESQTLFETIGHYRAGEVRQWLATLPDQ